jgi:hypothetical protein
MYIFGVLLLVALSYSQESFVSNWKATKEQNVQTGTIYKATAGCSVVLSYDSTIDTLDVDVDCGAAGIGSPIILAHIHKVVDDIDPLKVVPLVFATGDPAIDLLPPPATVSPDNKISWANVTSTIDFICNDHSYLNLHTTDSDFMVRANFVGMRTYCGRGSLPTTPALTPYGPEAPVDQMQSWALKLELTNPSSPSKCNLIAEYTPGAVFLTGSCDFTENIMEIHIVLVADNKTEFPFFPGPGMFSGLAPFSFGIPCDNNLCRNALCGSVAGTPGLFSVEVITDTDVTYSSNIDVGACPAITKAPVVKGGDSALSFTVYLTVLLALFSKWLF